MHILLVEEDVQTYLTTRQLLDIPEHPVSVDWAPNYDMATKFVRQHTHDLCLIGYHPSHKNQHQFLTWLYAQDTQLPVVLLVNSPLNTEEIFLHPYRADFIYRNQFTWDMLLRSLRYLQQIKNVQNQQNNAQIILENCRTLMSLLDKTGKIVNINQAAVQLMHLKTANSLKNQFFWEIPLTSNLPHVQAEMKSAIEAALDGEAGELEILTKTVDEQPLAFKMYVTPILESNGNIQGILVEGCDLTAQKQVEKELVYATLHDDLTGLPNRTLFIELLERAMSRAQNHKDYHLAVLYIDLDRFKVINESLGHDMGDWLLMEVSRRLQTCLGDEVVLARSGGDEFLILLNNLKELNEATRLAAEISEELANPFPLHGYEVVTSASIGIAYGNERTDSADLLRDADTAMYRAKTARSGFTVFNSGMHTQAVSRMQIESDLHKALEQENFVLFYQPQTDLITEHLVGAEALIRFQHPINGLMAPNHFIPILEDTGIIIRLGEWILQTACQQFKVWLDNELPIEHISVNLSPHQFRSKRLTKMVAEAIENSGIPAHCLELEITESLLLEDTKNAMHTLHSFQEMGVRVTIDDFGTGYASLNYLKRFPVDCLKIDKSFIDGVAVDPQDAAITVATIDMAHALGLRVIAEGVETIDQRDFLRDHGCDLAQGFLYSPPIEQHAFHEWAKQYQKVMQQHKR